MPRTPLVDGDSPLLLSKCWVLKLNDEPLAIYASDNELSVFISKSSGKVDALDPITGRLIWQSDFGGEIISGLVGDATNLFFVSRSSPGADGQAVVTLRAISKQTGLLNWKTTIAPSEEFYLKAGPVSVVALGSEGAKASVRKSDGMVTWRSDTGSKLAGIPQFGSNGLAYLANTSGEIESISLEDGRLIGKIQTPSTPTAIYLYNDQRLILGDKKGNLNAIDLQTKQTVWKFRNGAQISGIMSSGQEILVSSYDNFVYMMNPVDGDLLWKRRLSGRVAGEPAIASNFAALNVIGEPGISFLDLASGKLLNRLLFEDDQAASSAKIYLGSLTILGRPDGLYSFSTGKCPSKIESGAK